MKASDELSNIVAPLIDYEIYRERGLPVDWVGSGWPNREHANRALIVMLYRDDISTVNNPNFPKEAAD